MGAHRSINEAKLSETGRENSPLSNRFNGFLNTIPDFETFEVKFSRLLEYLKFQSNGIKPSISEKGLLRGKCYYEFMTAKNEDLSIYYIVNGNEHTKATLLDGEKKGGGFKLGEYVVLRFGGRYLTIKYDFDRGHYSIFMKQLGEDGKDLSDTLDEEQEKIEDPSWSKLSSIINIYLGMHSFEIISDKIKIRNETIEQKISNLWDVQKFRIYEALKSKQGGKSKILTSGMRGHIFDIYQEIINNDALVYYRLYIGDELGKIVEEIGEKYVINKIDEGVSDIKLYTYKKLIARESGLFQGIIIKLKNGVYKICSDEMKILVSDLEKIGFRKMCSEETVNGSIIQDKPQGGCNSSLGSLFDELAISDLMYFEKQYDKLFKILKNKSRGNKFSVGKKGFLKGKSYYEFSIGKAKNFSMYYMSDVVELDESNLSEKEERHFGPGEYIILRCGEKYFTIKYDFEKKEYFVFMTQPEKIIKNLYDVQYYETKQLEDFSWSNLSKIINSYWNACTIGLNSNENGLQACLFAGDEIFVDRIGEKYEIEKLDEKFENIDMYRYSQIVGKNGEFQGVIIRLKDRIYRINTDQRGALLSCLAGFGVKEMIGGI